VCPLALEGEHSYNLWFLFLYSHLSLLETKKKYGKEGVSGSNPEGGSSSFLEKAKFIPIPNYKNAY
jgi:hypothetical protein